MTEMDTSSSTNVNARRMGRLLGLGRVRYPHHGRNGAFVKDISSS
jgi:hypothetical protein